MDSGDLKKNLIDADCSNEMIKKLLNCYDSNDYVLMMKLLKEHRFYLLEQVRRKQKKLDYLDYLIILLKKRGEENEKL